MRKKNIDVLIKLKDTIIIIVARVKHVRQEPVGSCKIPIHSGSRIPSTVSGLRFQLFPGYSWARIRYPDMMVLSGPEPDDGSFNHLPTTGYESYPVVSAPDPDDGSFSH